MNMHTPTAIVTTIVMLALPVVLTLLGELAAKAGLPRTAHALLSLGPDVRRLFAGPKDGAS